MSSDQSTPPIKPNIKKENIKKSIEFADALMSQFSNNQSRHHPNRPLYYPVLMHGKKLTRSQVQRNSNVKQIPQFPNTSKYEFIQNSLNNECDLYIKLPISKSKPPERGEETGKSPEFISIGKFKYIMFDKENELNIIRKYKPLESAIVVDLLYVDSDDIGSEIIFDILSVDVNGLDLYYDDHVSKKQSLPPIYTNIQIYTIFVEEPKNAGGRGTTQKKRKTKNTNQKRKKTRKRHK